MGISEQDPVLIEVRTLVAHVLDASLEEVKADAQLEVDLGMDSLSCFELVLRLERAFGTAIPDDALHGEHTVGEIAQYLRQSVPEAA